MMKKYQKTITVYELHDGFMVEVHREKEFSEFYIYHKAYGIKTLMFGVCDCDKVAEEQIIEANAEDHMNVYKAEYFDCTNENDKHFM